VAAQSVLPVLSAPLALRDARQAALAESSTA